MNSTEEVKDLIEHDNGYSIDNIDTSDCCIGDNAEYITSSIKKRRIKKITVIFIIVVAGLLVMLVMAGWLYIHNVLHGINIENKDDIVTQAEEFENDYDKIDMDAVEEDSELDWDDMGYNTESMDGVINILLCGEEAMAESKVGARGRTDCIMIATINNNQKALKLTSIMRDTYVKIPGYKNNKINASYAIGGMPLLLKTVESNFGIDIDGYVLVGFDGFEDIIDALGGVEIDLTEKEVKYLNSTNYISEESNRNVQVGKHLLNGNQALGYSRVRYVETGNGLHDDFGRNYRQRTVLNQVFNRYKESSVTDVVTLLPKVMKLVTTDMSESTILSYAANVLTLGTTEIETYKVPVDNYYRGARVRRMSVLYITDIGATRNELHKFIFGTELKSVESNSNYYGEAVDKPRTNEKSGKAVDIPAPTKAIVNDTEPEKVKHKEIKDTGKEKSADDRKDNGTAKVDGVSKKDKDGTDNSVDGKEDKDIDKDMAASDKDTDTSDRDTGTSDKSTGNTEIDGKDKDTSDKNTGTSDMDIDASDMDIDASDMDMDASDMDMDASDKNDAQ